MFVSSAMPVVTLTIFALPPSFRKTTLCSFSRSSFFCLLCEAFVLDLGVVVGLFLGVGASFFFCSISSGLRLLSPVRMVTLCIGTATTSFTMLVWMSAVQLRPGRRRTSWFVEADLHLEIGHFLLRAGAGRLAGVGDLLDRAVEFPVAVGVDRDVRLIAELHVDDVVLVHVHDRLHVVEIGHPHHFGAGKLIRRHDALAELAVQHGDDAVERRIDRRLGKLIARLARARFRALDAVQAGLIHRFRRIVGRLRGEHLGLEISFLLEKILRLLEILLGFCHRRLLLAADRFARC